MLAYDPAYASLQPFLPTRNRLSPSSAFTHRIDFVFLKRRGPSGFIELRFDQFEIVMQQIIRVSGRCPAIHEDRYRAARVKDQNSTMVPVVQKPRMRKMCSKITNVLL